MIKGDTPAQNKIDKNTFEKLCGMWCTLIEIADFFGVSEDTVERWCQKTYEMRFADIYKKRSSQGNISLRRWQLKSAEKGNVTMQIWLGKQHLGQKENVEADTDKSNGILSELAEALKNVKKD